MRNLILILIFQSLAHLCSGQGLVINGGADTLTSCPLNMGEFEKAFPWYSPSLNTPDVFNECRLGGTGDVPVTGLGFQHSKNGQGFLGGILYPYNRDNICAKLQNPLQQGSTYCLSFYINLADYRPVAIDRIGVYLSADSIHYNTFYELPVTPQLETPEGVFFADTANWTLISFEYLAQGGEKYMAIGNFHNDSTTNNYSVDTSMSNSGNYYFFDDFSLVECKGSAVDENSTSKSVLVYPNPATSTFNIQYNLSTNAAFELYSIDGKKLDTVQLSNQSGTYTYSTETLSNGVYLYVIRGDKGTMATGKLVLIK